MLQPGDEKEIAVADLGSAGATMLLANNTSVDEGRVKIGPGVGFSDLTYSIR